MYASTKGGGMTLAFPNVCLTPAPPAGPVPVPYPSVGQCAEANPGTCSLIVRALNKPFLTVKSEVPVTKGDEAGTNGGVSSGTRGSVCKRVQGSTKVNIEGSPAVMALGTISSNGYSANAPMGNQLSPSQAKILILG